MTGCSVGAIVAFPNLFQRWDLVHSDRDDDRVLVVGRSSEVLRFHPILQAVGKLAPKAR